MKRMIDIVLAALGLLVLWPVIAIGALAVKLTSPGPAFFRQTRVGLEERPFICVKLRTMRVDTPNAPSHEVSGQSTTSLGSFLRKFKLDELPQLWNVLVGDMSLVGPRPCLPTQTALIEARRQLGLYQLRPGITGVAQVAGVDMSDPERLAALDATYLQNKAVADDLRLILQTVAGSGRGDRLAR